MWLKRGCNVIIRVIYVYMCICKTVNILGTVMYRHYTRILSDTHDSNYVSDMFQLKMFWVKVNSAV